MNLNLEKTLKLIGFLIVMFVSTWATVESIYRLVEWPKLIIWPLSILFFWAAAMGVKNIIKSFNYSERVQGRFKYLLAGTVLVLLFWIGLILPTNTHTFFYKREVGPTCLAELQNTKTALLNLSTQGTNIILEEKDEFDKKAEMFIVKFQTEILDPNRPGHKERAENELLKLDNLLGEPVQRLKKPVNNSFTALDEYGKNMAKAIRSQVEIKKKSYDTKVNLLKSKLDEENLNQILKDLSNEERNFDTEPTKTTKRVLLDGFGMINRYSDILTKQFPSLKASPSMKTPATIELENVFTTWGRFFDGVYQGKGFWYFILGAGLIDLLGFILYHIATKEL